MTNKPKSLFQFLRSHRKVILLIFIVAVASIVGSTVISILLSRLMHFRVPSLGTLMTLGVETYWDRDAQYKAETVDWGVVWPGSSIDVTLCVKSTSYTEVVLILDSTNWQPAGISEFMTLSWDYDGAPIHPNEVIPVTLTLSSSSSKAFINYLVTNSVKRFSFDIVIRTSEYE